MLGVTYSTDKMTMCFKGRHGYIIRTTYKPEGDVLQTYALFHYGYTYQIFMCNDTVSKIYLAKSLSLLDVRVMALFDTVQEKHHQCAMYNLYKSATIFKAAYNHEKKGLTHGVTRKVIRGIPPCIQQ